MEVSADRWKGRLDCGQTREKIYQDYLNNFFKIFLNFFIYFIIIFFIEIVSRGIRVFANPGENFCRGYYLTE